jgi:hypothetical protein
MAYRAHPPCTPLLFGYDPDRDLPADHLARFVEQVVEETVKADAKARGPGQPGYDPRLCIKVLLYGYATGVRASRQLERLCQESLPYLYLTRGDGPGYHTLCTARRALEQQIEAVWVHLFAVAEQAGIPRLGRIVVDSSKFRADVGPEAVLKAEEYEPVKEELRRILDEAEAADARDEQETCLSTRLGASVPREQMREILRRVRRRMAAEKADAEKQAAAEADAGQTQALEAAAGAAPEEPGSLHDSTGHDSTGHDSTGHSPQMLKRIKLALGTIQTAEEEGLQQACLTDPDARMMGEGRQKRVQPCHSWEVAADNGLLVAGDSTQQGADNARLEGLVRAAGLHEPGGVTAVDADSGYFAGDPLARLIASGLDTCVPDSNTAADLHRGRPIGTTRETCRGSVELTYCPQTNSYACPQGNELRAGQQRLQHGQTVTLYRAQKDCTGCPLAAECLKNPGVRRRTLKVAVYADILQAARQRFCEPAHQARYRHRAEAVETVFGFTRSVLQFGRWLLRGKQRVACEEKLLRSAYQIRKVHQAKACTA